MKKMTVLFAQILDDKGNRVISDRIHERAEAIFTSQDVRATIKVDGTATFLDEDGNWFSRRAVRPGKNAPEGFIPMETDPKTGITFGWEPIEGSSLHKAFKKAVTGDERPGTFELIGPKINGNPEGVDTDRLVPHGSAPAEGFPSVEEMDAHRDDLREFLFPFFARFREQSIEGIVWWIDGEPKIKLRVKDFFPEDDSRFKR